MGRWGNVGNFCLQHVEFYMTKSLFMWASYDSVQSEWATVDSHRQMSVCRPYWRGHKSRLSLSSPYVTPSARSNASQIAGIYEWQWHMHFTQARVPVLSNRLVFSFFQESLWNMRLYLETSNNRPAALCVLNTPFSQSLWNLNPSMWPFLFRLCVCIPPRALPNQGRDLTIDVCLKIVSSLQHNSNLLSLWGTNISANRLTADFKN